VPFVDELLRLGREAAAAAHYRLGASLLVQPRHDALVARGDTMCLAATMSGRVQYVELDGGHDLMRPGHSGHDDLLRTLTRFAWDAWEPVSDLCLPQYG
jgi:hypothetical protein